MSAAAFTIFWMKIKLEWHSVIFCSIGSTFGMVLGLEVFDDLLTPPVKKLGFVCIWFSFAFALFLLNRQHKRRTFDSIPNFGLWQGFILGKNDIIAVKLWGDFFVDNFSVNNITPCLNVHMRRMMFLWSTAMIFFSGDWNHWRSVQCRCRKRSRHLVSVTEFYFAVENQNRHCIVSSSSFSILSLLFRVNEKVSTPTSIVLMAINTCVG
jgi:hypothetical protein